MDSNKDLLAKAQEYSSSNVDLYELLQIHTTITEEKEIRRAWRKQSLNYHPDKLKDAFDPEKWELIETARDILLDAAARAAYDNARKAVLLRKAERDRVQGQRKRLIDELEAAEQEGKRQKLAEEERARELERERARLVEEGRRRMAEEAERFKRENLERLEREREPDEYDEKLAELQRRLDEKKRLKAEKKAKKKGGVTNGADSAAAPNTSNTPAPAPAPVPKAPVKWEDLKARMSAAQRLKEAKKAAEAGLATEEEVQQRYEALRALDPNRTD
ncbi:pre-mRNA-splicing factor CWF23 [Colletotrichum spaethianum]|uniref:Pre-mRNA-splicing factor CWF23 n=1 Tax=Colletotrichum spaethianum TaxID=700344 RepID=A0AA37UQ07_9PEZI|nr:pre-mRNA-splicing factor CWF23 [Colletotrichum spaethianum]GKT47927.1 pre-mRNA-splicing factor CWF23 [Colletotrichum spaethianum]